MAESVGGRKKFKNDSSSRSSNAISWQSWAEKYSISPETGFKEQTTDVVKIFSKDVGLYGFSPRYEDICLVVCKVCKQIYKMQALCGHYERRHAERLSQVLHQTMSSRKDYYGSSSGNTSLAHPSSSIPSVNPDPLQNSTTYKIKPPECNIDQKYHNAKVLKQKHEPAEKFIHPFKISNQEIFLTPSSKSGNPNLKPEFAKQTLNSTGSKKPSAFNFPGFIARKSMSNIFPSDKTSELCRSDSSLNSANSSRIISQTVSIKKTTLDSTSIYDFDDLTTCKHPSIDHNKSATKSRLKDYNFPEKSEVSPEKSSPFETNDKHSSILSSKVFKTPDQTSSKMHLLVPSMETGQNDILINIKKCDSKSTPSHKSNSEKTCKSSQPPSEAYHKVGNKKEERITSSLKLMPRSHVHSTKKLKHKMNSPLNNIKDTNKLNSSSIISKGKKRINNIYSSSPSSMSASSSRCSSPQKSEINNIIYPSHCNSSSLFKKNNVEASINNQVNQMNKKLSEMSKRDLLLNAKKSTKVKMSPKIENGLSKGSIISSLSSDEDSSKQFNGKSMSNKQISNFSIAEEYKKASKARHSVVSNSDSSDSELINISKNCRSSKPSSLQPKKIISHIEENERKFHKMSPKVSLENFPSSSSRKREYSSEDEEQLSSSERNSKKQKTLVKPLKVHSYSEYSPLKHKKTPINDNITNNITSNKMFMCNIKSIKEKKVERKDSVPSERRNQLQHGSRLHSFPSPSSSSEPVDSLDSPLSKSSTFPASKRCNKHITCSMDNIQFETSPVAYQPDIHCGVSINSNFPCMNSLSCQEHSISLRRAIGGRSKAFDLLLLSQTSKPKHPSTTIPPSSSYSIPSPPPSYINPKLVFNTSNTSFFSHSDATTVPEIGRSRTKSKKLLKSLSHSSSSPSASPPNSRVRNSSKKKYSPKSAFSPKDSPLLDTKPCKPTMNTKFEEMSNKVISSVIDEGHLKGLGMELDEENKELIENLIKDSEEDNNHGNRQLCVDGDYDNDYDEDEILKSISMGYCDSVLIRPSLLGKKGNERNFQRPKKLSTHRQENPVNLIGSEMFSSTSQSAEGISEFLDHHPKPVAVNSFGVCNLSSNVLSGMYVTNRRHDLLRQTFSKVVSRVNKSSLVSRSQNHPWHKKSLNFQMRINSCHLREVPPLYNTESSDLSEGDESEGDELLEYHLSCFRNLAPPSSLLKAFQTIQKKSNHVTSKPSTSINHIQCASNQKKGQFSVLQPIESSQSSKIDEKSHMILNAMSPPFKNSTEVVVVSSCVRTTNHQEKLHSSPQNKTTKRVIASSNISLALKEDKFGDIIKSASTSQEQERSSFKVSTNTNPSIKSAPNGTTRNIKFPVLTPSKFQHNGFVSSLSDCYMPPSVLNNSSFRNPLHSSLDIVSPSVKLSQTLAKSVHVRTIASPINGASFPPNIISFDDNNTNLILNYYTPSANTLNNVDKESRLHSKMTCFKNEDDSRKELYSGHQMMVSVQARGNSPDEKQQKCSDSCNTTHNRQPNNIPNHIINGNVSNSTFSLNSHTHNVQIPFANNFVHNRHHIMNIIGSSMTNQDNQLAQESTIFHKSNQNDIPSNEFSVDKIQQPVNPSMKAMIGS